ncbi:MAG: hypothetical protein M1826_000846 [Phylliscum demangeonii]|nr:MAG: hypothetical protein M1826_000846 [Phylliscum demangeonii]
MIRQDPQLVRKARTWIRRELQVFEFLRKEDSSNPARPWPRTARPEFLLEYLVSILQTVDINGSRGEAEEMLQEHVGRANARLFLHELRAWMRSPYRSLAEWDRAVQYAVPVPVPNIEISSVPQQGTDAAVTSNRKSY